MKYLLDTADIKEYNKWSDYIYGVTTNPKLISEHGDDIYYCCIKPIFIQVNSIEEFETIRNNVKLRSDKIYKVSMVSKNLDLINYIKLCKAKVAATTVYDLVQLNQAVEMGCDYSMVYLAKNPNPDFLEEAVACFGKSETHLVAASFRTKADVERAIRSGIEYATVPPAVLELAYSNLYVKKDVEENEQFSNNTRSTQ